MTAIRTTCPFCGVGCGVLAEPKSEGRVDIKGDPNHPANFGRLCSKGAALGETLSLDDRVLYPIVDGQRASWQNALDRVAKGFGDAIREHGPDSVALYVSGQLLTEDYYAANKLVKGFFGTANIDTNSRLCMASSVAGHKRAFGSDTVPGCYEDIDLADLVIIVGSNLAWCHPVLYQRLADARTARHTTIVVIDPRRTVTCDIADLHLPLAPGSDVALFNGLLVALADDRALATTWIDRHTQGFAEALEAAARMSIEEVSRITELPQDDVRRFYDLFLRTKRVVTIYSQGVNQSTAGTDKVNAIINCHLATGRIGKPGVGPFSVTGQPNAMGGRETGGLSNMLAAHMELGHPAHRRIVQSFWKSPRIADQPGLKAVDMFRAVKNGRIKALWIMATNPVASMPDADDVRAALEKCPFVVVSDVVRDTDTTAFADVLLPSLAWGEKTGTVTNSERRISRQRAFLDPPGEAKADWWQIAEVAQRFGYGSAFGWRTVHEIFTEYAQLTTIDNDGARDLDLGDVADLGPADYEELEPFQWPRRRARQFGDGQFFTSDRKGRFIATPYRPPAVAPGETYDLILNTGRIRDQWHTMTRTGKTSRLTNHIAEPFIEMHPDDAERVGLGPADIAELSSPLGTCVLRVLITERQRLGSVFAPIHWTMQSARSARVDALIAGHCDPVSGQPELKAAPVSVRRFPARWYGFLVSRYKPQLADIDYWASAPASIGWRAELAGRATPAHWLSAAHAMLGISATGDAVSYCDATTGEFRVAVFDGVNLVGALFVASEPVPVSRSWLIAQLGKPFESGRDRATVLSGRPSRGGDKGAIVCACFEVGHNQIAAAISRGCHSVEAVGAATGAGRNCGSCRAEIGRLLGAGRRVSAD